MADRGLTIRIPIWVRVSGIIALVLVGVVVSSMLLGGSVSGGQDGGSVSGGRDHGSQTEQTDHNGGQTGPAAPSGLEPAENPAPSGHQRPPQERGSSDGPDDPTPTPSHGSGDHTRSDGSRGH
ncbi:MAG: hypothetical protein M5U01_03460 [Ardenticatenaceae bacterium]|nr:hypothetical protein [Ardenticatenaceae bacterium]